jgi:negative regulator of flagellin synthesis FlgM
MKISKTDDTNIQLIQQYQRTDKVSGTGAETKALGNSSSPEEKVNLSATARDIQKLKNLINQLPDVRSEKVENLKKQVDQGTYKVDSEKVAGKMVGESLLDNLS